MKKVLALSIFIIITLMPCSVFAEETYTLTESELEDVIYEAVQNDPERYGVVNASTYDELERNYHALSEHMPDPEEVEETNDKNLIFFTIFIAVITFGYYRLYTHMKAHEANALIEAGKAREDAYAMGYADAKIKFQNNGHE